jgi:hypothetical protein
MLAVHDASVECHMPVRLRGAREKGTCIPMMCPCSSYDWNRCSGIIFLMGEVVVCPWEDVKDMSVLMDM